MERIFEAPRSAPMEASKAAQKVSAPERAKPDEAAERVSALVAEMKVLEAFFSEKKTEAKAAPEAPLKKAKLGEADLRDVSRPARPSQKTSQVTPRSCATRPKPSQKQVPKVTVAEDPLAETVPRPTTKLSTPQAATAASKWQKPSQDATSTVEPEEPEAEEPPESSDAKEKDFRDWLQRLDLGHKGTLMRYLNALKEQFDCDLKLLKCTQLAREVREDQSVVDIIEPNLWTSCNIEKRLHKLILAKGIFALDM